MTVAVEWSASEKEAWKPPEKLLPSQWSSRYRWLGRGQSSRFGQWKTENAPYAAGIMDLPIAFPQIRKMNLKKAAQTAGSEAVRCLIAYLASEEPDPCLLNLPDEKSGKRIFGKRILPLFEETDKLKALKSERARDSGLYGLELTNGFSLRLAWSGSDQSLASDPIRCVFNDEVNKFQRSATEADPIALAEVRTATYANSLVVNISTPTVSGELIDVLYESSPIKLFFFVPCPVCGHFQRLKWDRVHWEKYKHEENPKRRAGLIKENNAAWYECEKHGCKILDRHKQKMEMKGFWGTDDQSFKLFVDGRHEGELPAGDEVAMHLSGLYSLAAKHTFVGIAAEWVSCEGNRSRTQNFTNSYLGENFETQVSKLDAGEVSARRKEAPPALIVPEWAGAVLATADTQRDYFYWTIRAWGYGYRSQLIANGTSRTFDELYQATLESRFKLNGTEALVGPRALLIDSGGWKGAEQSNLSRTKEVYAFAMRDPLRIIPTKGASAAMLSPIARPTQLVGFQGVGLVRFDPTHFEDALARLIGDEDPTLWQVHNQVSDDYCLQLASRHKVLDKKSGKLRWKVKTTGAADHYRSCEILQCVAADMANIASMRPMVQMTQTAALAPQSSESNIPVDRWMNRGKKW